MPDHPSVRYAGMLAEGDLAMTAGATTSGGSSGTGSLAVADGTLQRMLGFAASDTTTRAAMLNLLKLEAPLAVQSRGEPGFFPTNKYSAVQELIRAAREAARETGGTDANFDARKRLMVVPQVPVLDIITETQADNWVRVTAVRAVDRDGQVYDIPLRTPADGGQGVAIIALGTIESTRLSLNTFQSSLAGRAAQRMGQNLVAHLRSNLTIRIPVSSLAALPAASQTSLQASALFAKGRVKIDGENRFFHLQITACGLNKAGVSSEAELFQKIPDSDQVSTMIAATDTHAVITLRGIGEMTPKNADSFIRLSPTRREGNRPAAEVTLANVKKQASTTPQSLIDQQTWDAMDALADEVSLILADGKAFEILAAGRWIAVAGGVPVAGVKAALPYQKRRDDLGTTHHDAGTMWMGDDPATSVTNAFGRIHDTANCYVNSPALFPSLGSPNPMLTGIALTRRTGEMLSASVLPRAPVRDAGAAGFTALFDGTVATRKKWQLAPRSSPVPNNVQGFGFSDGELISYGKSDDFALLYYAAQTFANFHLRLQFKVLDAANPNSGVFVRFRDPQALLPAALLASPRAVGTKIDKNPAWTAVISGFEVQIDDRAAAGPFTQRTGGLYLIDAVAQQYQAGPAARENVWMQYDIVATGNRFEVTLTDTETGETKRTALYDNPDASRGLPGYVGIQSYPGSPVAFRDIWIK